MELDATLSDEDAQAVLSMALNEILCEELRLQCQDLLRDRLGVSPLPGLAPEFRPGPSDAPGLPEARHAAWHPAAW